MENLTRNLYEYTIGVPYGIIDVASHQGANEVLDFIRERFGISPKVDIDVRYTGDLNPDKIDPDKITLDIFDAYSYAKPDFTRPSNSDIIHPVLGHLFVPKHIAHRGLTKIGFSSNTLRKSTLVWDIDRNVWLWVGQPVLKFSDVQAIAPLIATSSESTG